MSRRFISRRMFTMWSILSVCVLTFADISISQTISPHSIFLTGEETDDMRGATRRDSGDDDIVRRWRTVAIDAKTIRQVADSRGDRHLTFPLFADASFTGRIDQTTETRAGNLLISGHVVDAHNVDAQSNEPLQSGNFTLILTKDDELAGTINHDGSVYRVRVNEAQTHVVEMLDAGKLSRPLNPLVPPQDVDSVDSAIPPQDSRALAYRDDGTVVDVLVLYTDAVVTEFGNSESSVVAMIDLAEAETNQGYRNSGVNHRIRVVHAERVDYFEGLNELPLWELATVDDGVLDEVPVLRDQYGADVVVLLAQIFNVCGQAFITGSGDIASEFAYAVVAQNCATGFYSFGHEIGHTLGATHDRAEPDVGLFDYSHGYIGDGWRTVMAYANCSGNFCPLINYYSNPAQTYQGQPMGISAPAPDSADNVTTLNTTAFNVSNYRQTVIPVILPVLTNPDPNTASLSSSEQTFAWNQGNLNVTAYRLTVGTTEGANDLYDSGEVVGVTETLAFGLPVDGRVLYVRLAYRVGDSWQGQNYTFVAHEQLEIDIASPANGTTLTSADVNFELSQSVANGFEWRLTVGNAVDGVEHLDSGWLNASETAALVTGLPQDGRDLFVTLRYRSIGSSDAATIKRYQYTANELLINNPAPSDPDVDAVSFSAMVEPKTFVGAGQTLSVSFIVGNSNTIPLRNAVVESAVLTGGRCDIGDLWSGVAVTCSGTYTTGPEDVTAGSVTLSAALYFDGLDTAQQVTAVASYEGEIKDHSPTIAMTAVADSARISNVGQRVDFDISVANVGDEVISDVVVTNPTTGKTVCVVGTLWPGYEAICTEARFITTEDLNAGALRNVSQAICRERADEVVVITTVVPSG